MDAARVATDKRLAKMEKRLKKTYKKAAKGITKKWYAYMEESAKKLKPLQDAYDNAKLNGDTDAMRTIGIKLAAEKREQTIYNAYYKNMVNSTATRIANINKIALAYINDEIPDIYAVNYNAVGNDVFDLGISFALVDEHTVKRLAKTGTINLPKKKLDTLKDIRWNKNKLNSAVLQGILQGESIPKIAKRIQPIIDTNEASAIKHARTFVTGAECQGRLDSYYDLDDMGVVQEKEWVATPDDRTRESHLAIDGETVDLYDSFSNGCMYPGDTNGDPSEVWCCRCSIRNRVIGFRRKDGSISKINYKPSATLHDRQIDAERERRSDDEK